MVTGSVLVAEVMDDRLFHLLVVRAELSEAGLRKVALDLLGQEAFPSHPVMRKAGSHSRFLPPPLPQMTGAVLSGLALLYPQTCTR
jgi:hypothetical protein